MKIKFDCVMPENKWEFWVTWDNKKDCIPSLINVNAKISVEAKTEKEAIKMFNIFIKELKEREVEIQDDD